LEELIVSLTEHLLVEMSFRVSYSLEQTRHSERVNLLLIKIPVIKITLLTSMPLSL